MYRDDDSKTARCQTVLCTEDGRSAEGVKSGKERPAANLARINTHLHAGLVILGEEKGGKTICLPASGGGR
jgi:hypothetical protein